MLSLSASLKHTDLNRDMKTFISILRGINVAGKNKIPMADLKVMYEEIGGKDVITYIQSGNVIFDTKENDPQQLEKRVEKKILDKFGFKVPVVIRQEKELEKLIKDNPFLKEKVDESKLHVTFLAQEPEADLVGKIKEVRHEPDRFIVSGKEVYLYCPDGYGNTKLSNTFFENKLKVIATTRNWNTVNKLVELCNKKHT